MNGITKKIQEADTYIKRNYTGNDWELPSQVDMFLKWLPTGLIFLINPSRGNSLLDKIKIFTVAEGIRNCLVHPLKKITKRRRPNSLFKYNSFPSGHTATSFMGAHILSEEIKQTVPSVTIAAYSIAAATAALRVHKRKHWASDVIAGAVIGIISARLGYAILNKFRK